MNTSTVKVGLGSFILKIHAQTRFAGISRYQRIAHTLLCFEVQWHVCVYSGVQAMMH